MTPPALPTAPGSTALSSTTPRAAAAPQSKEDLRHAAQQFEAVLLRQMLASARATDFGGNDLFGDSDDTFTEMRDARFAELTAQSGQLGFAATIERQLARFLPAEAAGETNAAPVAAAATAAAKPAKDGTR